MIIRNLRHIIGLLALAQVTLFIAAEASATAIATPVQSAPLTRDQLQQMIVLEATRTNHVSPSIALAVAKIESGFRPHVVSSAGAVGVMQIMPRTGRDVFGLSRTELFDPAINIKAGVTFLDQLIEQYDGRIDLALSHYNGGSRVTAGSEPRIIPATRGYVLKVLAAAQAYQAGWSAPATDTQLAAASPAETAPAGESVPQVGSDSVDARPNAAAPAVPALHHPPRVQRPEWQQHLSEVDFWVTAARATLADTPPSRDVGVGVGTGPAAGLVMSMADNRQAFRHWLKANR